MEDENIALNSVLGLELNRVFFAVRDTANKQKIIEFARKVLQSEQRAAARQKCRRTDRRVRDAVAARRRAPLARMMPPFSERADFWPEQPAQRSYSAIAHERAARLPSLEGERRPRLSMSHSPTG